MMFSSFPKVKNPALPSSDPHLSEGKIPRRSNPTSFLSKMVFMLVMLMTMVSAEQNDCVCEYQPEVDYFPNKISPPHSTKFTIEYFNSYKKLTVMDGLNQYVTLAYLCGTPMPDVGNATALVEIPIKSAAATSIMYVSLLEYLGVRSSLHWVERPYDNFKPCLRKMYDQGQVVDEVNFPKINATAFERTGRALDVVFMDRYSYKYGKLPLQVNEQLNSTAIFVPEDLELTAFGKLDWLLFMSAFYNKERDVLQTFAQIESKYECVKSMVIRNPPLQSKKVLWGYCYYSIKTKRTDCYVAVCPNYYCDWIRDAGGDILVSKQAVTPDELYALAAQADVWIYTNSNWNESSTYSNAFFEGELKEKFSTLAVVQNEQVYDMLGTSESDWFEDDKAEPVVMLMDLVQVLYGNEYEPLMATGRKPKFFRNVFTSPKAYQGERLAEDCLDEATPVHGESYLGFCALAASPTLAPEPELCIATIAPTDAPTAPERSNGSFMWAFLLVLLMLTGVGAAAAAMGTWESRRRRYQQQQENQVGLVDEF
ncbi:hypothetical protein BASA81_000455 [Batrachochytrium salamandrivorans]|nr:hypothetical protein BASA81_000455 [Batrachochytrium salamandrivorans]